MKVGVLTRKPPLAEAQTAFENKKYALWNVGICSIAKIMCKTASSSKISLKAANRLLCYGQKTIFNMATVRDLEFSKFGVFAK